jgi:two-component system chemotaxis response regulator CheY
VPKTILIVDDSAFSRTQIKLEVKKIGLHVIGEAENGIEGVEKYKELKPDLVITDILMYGGSGIDALKGIMEYDSNAAVFVISSTAGQDHIADEAVKYGAKMVLRKPFDVKKFEDYLKTAGLL